MPEIKNTFVSSKMNKDLDERLIPKTEYRDAQNASVSKSEGPDVGALENIRGNIKLTDFGLTDDNLEIIGYCIDTNNDRIFLFITDYVDVSTSGIGNEAPGDVANAMTGTIFRYGSNHYICCWSSTGTNEVLVKGSFLNFSKNSPIIGAHLLENLLFWTDNRNQPRKINVDTALKNPLTYYTNEDHISVAKYAPYKAISFIKSTNDASSTESTMRNEVDEYLAPCFVSPGEITGAAPEVLTFGSSVNAAYVLPTNFLTVGMRVYNSTKGGQAFVQAVVGNNVTLKDSGGAIINNITTDLGWVDADVFCFQPANPDYNVGFLGDKEFLKDKFVRFSYRFKYDDDEYSLMAPFSQHAFIPEQHGYFVQGDNGRTKESGMVEFMQNQVNAVDLMIDLPTNSNLLEDNYKVKELQILYKESNAQSIKVVADVPVAKLQEGIPLNSSLTTAGTGYTTGVKDTTGGTGSGMKINVLTTSAGPPGPIATYSISASGEGYKIGDVVTVSTGGADATITITGNLSTTFLYTYASQKPIKTLPSKEITRVSDIVPIRAQTQEIVGNRVIYGNFLQNSETPESWEYTLSVSDKTALASSTVRKEFCNHTLKQGRSYQVGVVLMDRYGRSSNVILNDKSYSSDEISTIYSSWYNGGSDPLRWPGRSLKITFNEQLSKAKTETYLGLYNNDEPVSNVANVNNPLGWYTYKIVVKQQEQEYYNVYVPGILSGNINYVNNFTPINFTEEESVAHISLFNDNINKVPRDLKEVGATDSMYGSETVLYNRVYQPTYITTAGVQQVNQQFSTVTSQDVTTLRPFRELGEWTTKKNIDNQYTGESTVGNPTAGYVYPGSVGQVNPLYLKNNKNPIIATLSTKERLGFTAVRQDSLNFNFSKSLCIFETKPFESSLDIYYETSSTGLIRDINVGVYASLPVGAPTGISPFVFSLDEGSTSGYQATNTFEVVTGANKVNDPLSNVTLDSVKSRRTGQVINGAFALYTITPGAAPSTSPTFGIRTTKDFVYDLNSWTEDDWEFNMTATAPTISPGQTISITKTGFLGNVPPEILAITFNSIGGVKLAYDSTDVYKTDPVTPTTFAFNGALPAIPRSDFNSVWRWTYTEGGFQFPITRNGVGTKGFFNGSGSSDPVFYENGLEFKFGTPSQTKIYRWPAVCIVGGNVSINTSLRQNIDPSEFNLMRPKTQNWNTKGPIIRFIGSDIKFRDYSLWSITGSIPSGKWPGWLYEIPITLWDASRTGQSVTNYLRFVVYN